MQVKKRDGTLVAFDKEKIVNAINKAFIEVDGMLYENDTANDIADEIYLTYIDAHYDGDRFFPELDMNRFVICDIEQFDEDIRYAFIHLIRKD